ncbi:MAG TPA: MarR family winged helix-turn-helix transcriptional regulator [Pseudonocardiaceae bacterium]|jgi:DNA-binding MarR family transcriptional regulator|nr:MarR family winged helix-turn-helix transcriptional regulator [Pseudonocardiaceae bacterium]
MHQLPTAPEGNATDGPDACCTAARMPAAAVNSPVSHTIVRLARLHHMLAGQLLRRSGLHTGQELVMMYLWENGPQRQVDLIRLLDSDAATMTRSLQRLERAGFVNRRPSPTDRRSVIIEPTAASQALREQVEAIWPQLDKACLTGFTETERAEALGLLERLETNLAAATVKPETSTRETLGHRH